MTAEMVFLWEPEGECSDTCVKLGEWLGRARSDAEGALHAIAQLNKPEHSQNHSLFLTALKKYVEDTCLAIKEMDNILKRHGSSLDILIFEIPNTNRADDMSWRNLIGRRDVIAHNLLTIDNKRVYDEAVRDFTRLHQLLSKISFVPYKTDTNGGGVHVGFNPDGLKDLVPHKGDEPWTIGQSLIFISEHKQQGLVSFRVGRADSGGNMLSTLVMSSSFGGIFNIRLEAFRKSAVDPIS